MLATSRPALSLIVVLQLDEDAAERVRQIDLEFALARRAVYVKRRQCTRDIPDFWSMCLQQHPYLMECMTGSDDLEILAYLEEVQLWIEQACCH